MDPSHGCSLAEAPLPPAFDILATVCLHKRLRSREHGRGSHNGERGRGQISGPSGPAAGMGATAKPRLAVSRCRRGTPKLRLSVAPGAFRG